MTNKLKSQIIERIELLSNANRKNEILPGEHYIPVTGKLIDEDDILLGVDAALDGWLTAGRFAEQFERDFAAYFGAYKALLVNSGFNFTKIRRQGYQAG
jgi:CDP-6-deoxy-D-xylo-4-hexulose-3-dehydrase